MNVDYDMCGSVSDHECVSVSMFGFGSIDVQEDVEPLANLKWVWIKSQ
jgi:hypothetical protein